MENNFLSDKVWLITGATSGLGRALAMEVLRGGGKVAAVARHPRDLEAFHEFKGRFIFIEADISMKDAIHRLTGEVVSRLGRVDVLVNGASTLGPTPLRQLCDIECEEFGEVLETNLLGPFRLTKAVLPSMILAGTGTVVNISSDAAKEVYANWGVYGSSKAALDHLTRIWQSEISAVRFVAIDPGEMDTPMHAAAIPDADVTALSKPSVVARKIIERLNQVERGEVRQAV